jgi:hypothetical protein
MISGNAYGILVIILTRVLTCIIYSARINVKWYWWQIEHIAIASTDHEKEQNKLIFDVWKVKRMCLSRLSLILGFIVVILNPVIIGIYRVYNTMYLYLLRHKENFQ